MRRRPCPSLISLCLLVAVVAVDLARFQEIFGGRRSIFGFEEHRLDPAAPPMATVLLLGAIRLRSMPGPIRSFVIGFEASGLVALVGLITLLRRFGEPVGSLLRPIINPIEDALPRSWYPHLGPVSTPDLVDLPLLTLLTWGLQILDAWAGGRALAGRGSRRVAI